MSQTRAPLCDPLLSTLARVAAAGSRRRRSRFRAATTAALAALALAGPAIATTPVDCDTPDDFCTGDPCIPADDLQIVVSSCVLDFSPRVLRTERSIAVPNGGTLSLSAADIIINGKIVGAHVSAAEGDGADIALHATGGPPMVGYVLIQAPIDVSGRNSAGDLTFTAAGPFNLSLGSIRSRARGAGATASGGTVTITSGGQAQVFKKIDVRGRKGHTTGGTVSVTADGPILVESVNIDARGFPGGAISLVSASADVVVTDDLRAQGWPDGAGGTIGATAAFDVVLARADASGIGAGSISVQAGGTASAERLSARGFEAGLGGSIGVVAGTVSGLVGLDARGGSGGGTVSVESTVGDLSIYRVAVRAVDGPGGTVAIQAAGDGEVSGDILANGTAGGEIRVAAAGDLTLGGGSGSEFDARGDTGGAIEAQAGGTLTAVGDFSAQPGGCVGLSAGGTLDTSGATFDVPLTASCP